MHVNVKHTDALLKPSAVVVVIVVMSCVSNREPRFYIQEKQTRTRRLGTSVLFQLLLLKMTRVRSTFLNVTLVLSPAEFNSLKELGEKMAGLTSEDQLTKDGFFPETAKEILKCLHQEGEDRDRQARCAWYLCFLIRLAQMKKLDRKLGENECPQVLFRKVQKTFTVESFDKGRLKNIVTTSSVIKIASHCLALLLHIGDLKVDLTLLHRDLSITETKMLEVAKAMGLTLSRQSFHSLEEAGLQDDHKMASLVLPLVRYERRMESRKRKKMK